MCVSRLGDRFQWSAEREHDTERRRMGRSLSPPLVFLRSHPGDFLSLSLSGHLTLWESSPQARRLLYTIIHWLMRSFRVFCWVDKSHRQFLSLQASSQKWNETIETDTSPATLIYYGDTNLSVVHRINLRGGVWSCYTLRYELLPPSPLQQW